MSAKINNHFGRTAAKYTASESHARGADLTTLLERLPLCQTDIVVDIATGTGHTALAVAPCVARVVGVDSVSAMIREARILARDRGIANVTWVRSDAASTGLASASFDVVTCRRAAHHFADVTAFLAESRRLLRRGGTLGIVDQIPPENGAAAELTEGMEKLHDPSHGCALSASEWARIVEAAEFETRFSHVIEDRVSLEQFVSTARDPAVARSQVDRQLDRATSSVLNDIGFVVCENRVRSFIKRRLVLVARRR
ncbi:MAG: class I SAM-dependent methyltransferase [Armatimonadetes bacterium]|nr:class I SAM-dependent methyltransferase [Armatimonadota bacterium]